MVARFWKFFRPKTKIVHWCFDLYPEAAIAEGVFTANGLPARAIVHALRPAYRACNVIADLGPCMRRQLLKYPSTARRETLVPWALEEPDAPLPLDVPERQRIFGKAKLALLYSGNFGRAHSYREVLDLIELLNQENVKVAFSVRGNREAELRAAVESRGLDVPFPPFASADQLTARLACADVHVVTLRREWTGTVVPSKFFGALSAGRPVLFAGSSDSSLAHWIREDQTGWVLDDENISEVALKLLEYASSPAQQEAMRARCFFVYREHFSRAAQIRQWDDLLRWTLVGDSIASRPELPAVLPQTPVYVPDRS
jgi:glycosyltransferase involved in cell wall biosynthesis